MKLKFKMAATLLALAGLAACGGGGTGGEDGDGTLWVDLEWTGQAYLMMDSTITPNFSGLDNHKPHCTLKSGNLPPGMSMQDNCYIVGKPQARGSYSFVADFSVTGVENQLSFAGTAMVVGPETRYNMPIFVKYGQTIDAKPFADIWRSQPGTTFAYQITSGSLPPGLTLDANTGRISGTISGIGDYAAVISTQISSSQGPLTVPGTTVNFHIANVTVTYPYISAVLGVPFAPVLPTTEQVGLSYSFAWDSGFARPPGLTLDPNTGGISGTLTQVQSAYDFLYLKVAAGALAPQSVRVSYYASTPYSASYSCPAARVNQAYSCSPTISVTPAASQAGVTPSNATFAYAVAPGSSLPQGLTLDATTGVISGTPTVRTAGTVGVNITASLGGATFVLYPRFNLSIN